MAGKARQYVLMMMSVIMLVGAFPNKESGQQFDKTGSLTVNVTDADINLPVIGCMAFLTSGKSGSPLRCNSDQSGKACFRDIASGIYQLKVSLTGYFPEFIDSVTVYADSAVTISLLLHPYNGFTEYDAYDDLAKGIVRLYRDEWFVGPGADVSLKYGFRHALKCCDPTFKFDRYNNVVYNYLDSLNGRGWYDAYIRDLAAATAASDSIRSRSGK